MRPSCANSSSRMRVGTLSVGSCSGVVEVLTFSSASKNKRNNGAFRGCRQVIPQHRSPWAPAVYHEIKVRCTGRGSDARVGPDLQAGCHSFGDRTPEAGVRGEIAIDPSTTARVYGCEVFLAALISDLSQ